MWTFSDGSCINRAISGPGVRRDRLFGTMALGRRNCLGVMAEGGTVWGDGGRRNCLYHLPWYALVCLCITKYYITGYKTESTKNINGQKKGVSF